MAQKGYDSEGFYNPAFGQSNPQGSYSQGSYAQFGASQDQIFTPSFGALDASPGRVDNDEEDYENEAPLLEELGINFSNIGEKTVQVVNPFREPSADLLADCDLAGPLVFGLAFGASLLLSGKVHFGFIYGHGVIGCGSMYLLLNLMSSKGIDIVQTISILGYCLLPMIFLSFSSAFLTLTALIGNLYALVFILWCSLSASKIFVRALEMKDEQLLVAYPCFLIYGVFALLAVF